MLVNDGHAEQDLLRSVVEIKGYRREDAREKADTMRTYWVPGVNGLRTYGRWDFAEFGDVYPMQAEFAAKVEAEFGRLVEGIVVARGAAARSPGTHGSPVQAEERDGKTLEAIRDEGIFSRETMEKGFVCWSTGRQSP